MEWSGCYWHFISCQWQVCHRQALSSPLIGRARIVPASHWLQTDLKSPVDLKLIDDNLQPVILDKVTENIPTTNSDDSGQISGEQLAALILSLAFSLALHATLLDVVNCKKWKGAGEQTVWYCS